MSPLILIQRSPLASASSLDMVLALSAFDLTPDVLFVGEGVLYLIKKYHQSLNVLPLYECGSVLASECSLMQQQITIDPTIESVYVATVSQIQSLIAQSTHCISL
jgi:sulfur relay (sulfurtransferase) DsrF/TusC family protein